MTDPDPAVIDAGRRAHRFSPFLRMAMEREPALATRTDAGYLDEPKVFEDMPIGRRLRLERRALALHVAIGDLSGRYDLSAVTTRLTRFADRALDQVIRAAIAERTPDAEPCGFVAIALGKQGSFELNYSSDIDPIFLYDPITLPRRAREEPAAAAARIGRRIVELLQARDADGYVLRVDLRLRPSPEVTPVALPVDAAIGYYESQALPWERAAFIRARAAAGDIALGQRFLDAIRPFVWRRALDYGAVGELRAMTRRIRDHRAQGQLFGPGYDLKRGRGGIREVEFFAQIHQLIHGGRDPALRAPATRDALAALAAAGWIEPDAAITLSDGYIMLRTIEHRVQMIDDRQTHTLPTGTALEDVARLHGLEDDEALLAVLLPRVKVIGRAYDALDDDETPRGLSRDPVRLADALSDIGFEDDAAAVQRITDWRAARFPALRSTASQEALEAVLPSLLPAFAASAAPQAALLRFDALLAKLPSAVNFLRLLQAQPAIVGLLAAILSHAAPLADALAAQPSLLDALLDIEALDAHDDVRSVSVLMRGGERRDYQSRLDHVRHVVAEHRFASGTRIIAGIADPLSVARDYAILAEAAVEVLADATIEAFAQTHGAVAESEFVILALGRLGGGAMTHASDLDLVYLFTGDFTAMSNGGRPLGATLYYNRLAQRVTAALSVPTAAGPLYPVDTRLRPSGNQGPLVVNLDSFARYQREDAWTWEHMALTRARPIFGSPSARRAAEAVIADALMRERGRPVVPDVARMREEMTIHKPPAGPLDVKLLPGGLVDLEFAVHALQLRTHVGITPDLRAAVGTLIDAGLMPQSMLAAHDLLTRMLVTIRLVAPHAQVPTPATCALIARSMDLPGWDVVIATLEQTRQDVSRTWQTIRQEA